MAKRLLYVLYFTSFLAINSETLFVWTVLCRTFLATLFVSLSFFLSSFGMFTCLATGSTLPTGKWTFCSFFRKFRPNFAKVLFLRGFTMSNDFNRPLRSNLIYLIHVIDRKKWFIEKFDQNCLKETTGEIFSRWMLGLIVNHPKIEHYNLQIIQVRIFFVQGSFTIE